MDPSRHPALRRVCLALDAVILALSVAASFGAHAWLLGRIPRLKEVSVSQVATLAYLMLPAFLVLVAALDLHTTFERPWTRGAILGGLAKLHALALLALSLLAFATQIPINRSLVALFFGATFTLMYVERAALSSWQRAQRAAGRGATRLVLLGADDDRRKAFREAAGKEPLPPVVVGEAGSTAELETLLEEQAVDQVLVFPPLADGTIDGALGACEERGIAVGVAVEVAGAPHPPPRVASLAAEPFLIYEVAPKPPGPLALKHGFDVVAAALLLVVLAPVLLVAALLVAITMGRPLLFVQERAGLFGRRFSMIKLRTMRSDAEAEKGELASETGGPTFKMKEDPRITPVGRILRKASIDELPQLFNVLSGSMSLVGPRPLPSREQMQIRGWHRRRLSMKPGITGLWQVSGRSDVPFARWMELDLEYVDRWSLGLDAKILAKTIPAVLTGRGAR